MNGKKLLWIFVGLMLSGIFVVFFLFYVIGFGFSFPPCSERIAMLEVPEYLRDVTVKFETPMISVREKQEMKHCAYPANSGKIHSVDKSRPGTEEFFRKGGFAVDSVRENEEFVLVGRIYLAQLGLFGENPGDTYLLKDKRGEIWMINHLSLENVGYNFKNKPWNAGYYSETGERLGDVVVDTDFSCGETLTGKIIDCGKLKDKQDR